VSVSVLRQARPPQSGHDDQAPPDGDGDPRGRTRSLGQTLGFGRRPGAGANGAHDPRGTIAVRPNAQVAARVGLWALVVLGAVGGLFGLLRPTTQTVAPTDDGGSADVAPPEVAGFGEVAVTTWVESGEEGGEEALDPLFSVDPSASSGDVGRRRVNGDATAVGVREVGDDYWAVTVVAPVDEYADGKWQPAGNWYMEVGVARTDGGLVAISEPAIVPAPEQAADSPEPAGEGLGVPSQDDEEMATTVEGFLSALLAGNGDVSRYLAPDVEMTAVTPAPFREVTLQRWAVTDTGDGTVRVRLSARAMSPAGNPRTVSYEIGLAERAGRWEVTSLSGAPTIESDDTEPVPTTTPAPATTATTDPPETDPAVTTTVSIASEPGA
jgi:hypothetical protein